MLFLLDKKLIMQYELLFGKGSLLEGLPVAEDKIRQLQSIPYTLGLRELGAKQQFENILNSVYNEINQEVLDYRRVTFELLGKKLTSFNDNETVASFLESGMNHVVRGARMMNVIDLKYHYTSTKSKINDEVYEMLRIYFTSDKGKRVRCVSKNLGNLQQTHTNIAIKILKLLGYTKIELGRDNRCDLIAKLDHKFFEIDFKIHNRSSLIEIYAFIYLWQLYLKSR
jgi:hypothetical protein